MNNLLIGDTSQLAKYFPENFEKVSSRNIDFKKISKAYDLPYFSIKNHDDIDLVLEKFLKNNKPSILEVFTDENESHEPRVIPVLDENRNFIPGKLSNIQWI